MDLNQLQVRVIRELEINECALGLIKSVKALIVSQRDYDEFVSDFYSRYSRVKLFFALQEYKQYKIKRLSLSESEFLDMFDSDAIGALEVLYQDFVWDWELKYMQDKGISPEQVYKRFTDSDNIGECFCRSLRSIAQTI
ncbi:hypothetical protein GGQ84_001884 [Desulfitispora alkaliphila]|uniref:hypothetical protein n=1 Tax=Desulfitispora alkaliphila TaxID=622674 RepID=UPI003D1C93A0